MRFASTLALDTAPVTWPVGRAADVSRAHMTCATREMHLTEPNWIAELIRG